METVMPDTCRLRRGGQTTVEAGDKRRRMIIAPDRLFAATGHGGIRYQNGNQYYYAVVSASDRQPVGRV